MAKSGKGKVHIVSISIRWREEEAEQADGSMGTPHLEATAPSQRSEEVAAHDDKKDDSQGGGGQRSNKRLLPSDRIILDALRAYIPIGKQATTPVRLRELMATSELSRRQVQICLKRLADKGLIMRLLDGVGNQEGYRFLLSPDVLR
jgi:hypothetical protein